MDYEDGGNFDQSTKQSETSSPSAPTGSIPIRIDIANKAAKVAGVAGSFAGPHADCGNENVDVAFQSDEKENPFRRSSSLRIRNKHASTSAAAQKKIVRFADVLGLDLANVRTFLDELPSVPKSAYDDLENEVAAQRSYSGLRERGSSESLSRADETATKSLLPTFRLPVDSPDFVDRVRDRCVCLETVSVREAPVRHIIGRIRVVNLDFCKSVHVRYTLDDWKTYAEARANHVPDACDHDQFYNKFAFVIYVYDTIAVGQRIEFAIRYHCRGSVYWDNNDGNNYALQCSPSTPSIPSYFHCANISSSSSSSSSCADNFHSLFY